MRVIIITISLALFTSVAIAGEPKITETESGYIVEYTGTPEVNKAEDVGRDGLTRAEREDLKREIQENITRLKGKVVEAERQVQARQNTSYIENDVKVSSVNAMEMERSYGYVTYSIKADIDNKGERGEVYIKLIAKNRDGHQVHSTYLNGLVDRRGSRTITTTTMLSYQQAMDVREWAVDSVNKYKK